MGISVADIRNIVFCGHGNTGKTTLIDLMLIKSGAVTGHPSVDAGTSICDFDDEEKHHKHSVEATVTHFDHKGKRLNVIDTPGYPDLVGQMIGSLRAAETAVIAIDAHAGIKVNTRRAWAEAERAGCGKMIVLTKLDNENIDFPALIDNIKEVFGNACTPLNVPLGLGEELRGVASTLSIPDDTEGAALDPSEIGEALMESIIEVDEGRHGALLRGRDPLGRGAQQADGAGDRRRHVGADPLRLREEGGRRGGIDGRACLRGPASHRRPPQG